MFSLAIDAEPVLLEIELCLWGELFH